MMSAALNAIIQGQPVQTLSAHEAGASADRGSIEHADRELESRGRTALSAIIALLTEQRNRALLTADGLQRELDRQRQAMGLEHDRYLRAVAAEHQKRVDEIERQLATARAEIERRRALAPILPVVASNDGSFDLTPALLASEQRVASLQQLLESAYLEVDEARRDAARLQEERDDAVRRIDEARDEHSSELETARAEAHELQYKVDALSRELQDARDEARADMQALIEQLEAARLQIERQLGTQATMPSQIYRR